MTDGYGCDLRIRLLLTDKDVTDGYGCDLRIRLLLTDKDVTADRDV